MVAGLEKRHIIGWQTRKFAQFSHNPRFPLFSFVFHYDPVSTLSFHTHGKRQKTRKLGKHNTKQVFRGN